MTNLEEMLKEIRPEEDFSASTDFIGDGLLDSFDLLMLVSALDRRYGISIAGTDILPENFRNLGTIRALLRRSGGVL